MKKSPPAKKIFRILFATALAAGLLGATAFRVSADEAKAIPSAATNAPTSTVAPEAAQTELHKKLTGSELYSMHCNRCHPERFPTERTAAQWKTVMLHMQVRASIPGNQARLILQYLQENSGR
jgi:hypothetical protein